MFKYYGFDLLGGVLILLSLYLIGGKKRYGFLVGIAANTSYFIFGIMAQSMPTVLTNVVLILLNTRGYLNWSKTGKT